VDLYQPLIHGWLIRNKVRPQDADDLCQDVLANVVKGLAAFEHSGRPGAFRNWLRTIAVNRSRAVWRSLGGRSRSAAADAFLENALRLGTVVTTIDCVAGDATIDRFQEATMQAACADRLVMTKTDLAAPPHSLTERLEALNPMATIFDAATADPATLLFDASSTTAPRGHRFVATVPHTHGIGAFVLRFRRGMTRLDFAMALGGLARDRGEDLLRVKGLMLFADDDVAPAAIHAVQHTLYPPEWLDGWPDADHTSRLVFITRDIQPAEVMQRFAAGDPVLSDADKGEN